MLVTILIPPQALLILYYPPVSKDNKSAALAAAAFIKLTSILTEGYFSLLYHKPLTQI